MDSNNIAVTTALVSDHYLEAQTCLNRAASLSVQIGALLAQPKEARDYPEVNRLAGRQRAEIKRAEVHALLAIADNVSDLYTALTDEDAES